VYLVPGRHKDNFLFACVIFGWFAGSNKISTLKTVSTGGRVPSDRHDLFTLRRITADHQHEGCGEWRIHPRVAMPVVRRRHRFRHRGEPQRPRGADVERGSSSRVRTGGGRAVQIQAGTILIRF
jgi:hypothetical protein